MSVRSTLRKTVAGLLRALSLFVVLGSILAMTVGRVPVALAQGQGPDRQPQGVERSIGAPVQMDTAALQVKEAEESAQAPAGEVASLPIDLLSFATEKGQAQNKALKPSKEPASDASSDVEAASEMGPSAAPLDGADGPAPLDPTSNKNFIGLDENGLIPPDTMIAAGPSNLVEVVNDEIAVVQLQEAVDGPRLVAPAARDPADVDAVEQGVIAEDDDPLGDEPKAVGHGAQAESDALGEVITRQELRRGCGDEGIQG